MLVFRVGLDLGQRLANLSPRTSGTAALAAGLLFAIYPVNVEPVAWTCGRKLLAANVLALLSWLSWRRSDRRGAWRVAAITLFVLACLSNAAVIALPLIMAAHDFFLRRRGVRAMFLANIDFFLVAAGKAVYRLVRVTAERDLPGLKPDIAVKIALVIGGLWSQAASLLLPVGLVNLCSAYPVRWWRLPLGLLLIVL